MNVKEKTVLVVTKPGMDGEMRLRQYYSARDSATIELVEQVAEYGEAGPVDGVVTKTTQLCCVS